MWWLHAYTTRHQLFTSRPSLKNIHPPSTPCATSLVRFFNCGPVFWPVQLYLLFRSPWMYEANTNEGLMGNIRAYRYDIILYSSELPHVHHLAQSRGAKCKQYSFVLFRGNAKRPTTDNGIVRTANQFGSDNNPITKLIGSIFPICFAFHDPDEIANTKRPLKVLRNCLHKLIGGQSMMSPRRQSRSQ